MRYSNRNRSDFRQQRGAALVVGLLLLVVITLLAIGGMNSASVELVMAGNTQYQQRAFQAAEMGIERMMVTADFIPGVGGREDSGDVQVPGLSADDKFSATLTSDLDGLEQPALASNKAFNVTTFSTYHFTLASVGYSSRNARDTHTQGVIVLAPKSPTPTPPSGLGAGEAGLRLE